MLSLAEVRLVVKVVPVSGPRVAGQVCQFVHMCSYIYAHTTEFFVSLCLDSSLYIISRTDQDLMAKSCFRFTHYRCALLNYVLELLKIISPQTPPAPLSRYVRVPFFQNLKQD